MLLLQVSLVNLQAKVGYALIGIAGEKLLKQLGYPHMSVIVLLHRILDMAGIKVCILGVKVRNMKMDFNTGGIWHRVGQ